MVAEQQAKVADRTVAAGGAVGGDDFESCKVAQCRLVPFQPTVAVSLADGDGGSGTVTVHRRRCVGAGSQAGAESGTERGVGGGLVG